MPGRNLPDFDRPEKKNRLRLDIQPRDGLNAAPYTHYYADYNAGRKTPSTPNAVPNDQHAYHQHPVDPSRQRPPVVSDPSAYTSRGNPRGSDEPA
jgi:hypothetical protein